MLFFRFTKQLIPPYHYFFDLTRPRSRKQREIERKNFYFEKGFTVISLLKELPPNKFLKFCKEHGFKVNKTTIDYLISKGKLGYLKKGRIVNIEILAVDRYLQTFLLYVLLKEYIKDLKTKSKSKESITIFEKIVEEDYKKKINFLVTEKKNLWDKLISFLYKSFPWLYTYWHLLSKLLKNEFGDTYVVDQRFPAERHYYAVVEREKSIKNGIINLMKKSKLDEEALDGYIDKLVSKAAISHSSGFYKSIIAIPITFRRRILYDTYEVLKGNLKYSFFLLCIADYLWHILKYILGRKDVIHPTYRYVFYGTRESNIRNCVICGRRFVIKRRDAKCCSSKECQRLYKNYIKRYFRRIGEYLSSVP